MPAAPLGKGCRPVVPGRRLKVSSSTLATGERRAGAGSDGKGRALWLFTGKSIGAKDGRDGFGASHYQSGSGDRRRACGGMSPLRVGARTRDESVREWIAIRIEVVAHEWRREEDDD
jgi:hypothetical protein